MSNIVELSIPQPSQVAVTDAQTMLAAARQFVITNAEQSVELQSTRQRINTRIKTLTEERMTITRPIDEAKAKVMEFFKPPLIALDDALKACDTQIVAWTRAVEEQRREAQRKADLEAQRERERLRAVAAEAEAKAKAEQAQRDLEARQAREQVEAEQQRLQKIADAARAAGDAEAARKAETEAQERRSKAEAEQRERDRVAEAAKLTAQSKVEQFSERAETTVAEVAQVEAGSVKGVGLRDNWTFELLDVEKISRAFLMPDTVKIGKMVKALKGEAELLIGKGGVRVLNQPIVASRKA